MTNFSFASPSPPSAKQESHTMDNDTLHSCSSLWSFPTDIKQLVIFIIICVACIFGFLGNGTVIWLLGFRMKRNPVTIYILNLAVADFGILISVFPLSLWPLFKTNCKFKQPVVLHFLAGITLFHFMLSTSQFLLTLISVDRCVSVLFPLWYRCHRPEKLSTVLCAAVWILCFIVHGICNYFDILEENFILLYVFLVDALVSLPLITISTLILFIRFCFKSKQRRRKKLLTAVLLTLFFFLFFAFPMNVIHLIIMHSPSLISEHVHSFGYLCASLNSCVNPLIYFLVGRKKAKLCAEDLKLILQRVFKQEEEVYGEELQPSIQAQLPA